MTCVILNPVVGEDGSLRPAPRRCSGSPTTTRRVPVQIKAKLPFGSVTLRLEKITTETATQ